MGPGAFRYGIGRCQAVLCAGKGPWAAERLSRFRGAQRHGRVHHDHALRPLVRALSDEEDDNGEFVVVPDDQLDLDQLLTEDILLDVPSKFLCSPGCKGLCPTCGKNLNQGPCGCERDTVDPRLAVLKDLL